MLGNKKRTHSRKKNNELKLGARFGLEVGPEGIGVALVDMQSNDQIKLLDCGYIAERDPLKQRALLLQWTNQYSKRGIPSFITLHPSDYQFLLVETPKVPEKEMPNAMRGRLQDLLNYSVDLATYDLFKVPDDAYRGRISMAYVAAAPSVGVDKIVSMANKNNMKPIIVSVREISYRNLKLLSESESESENSEVISVWLDDFSGSITLLSKQNIYFSRRLEKNNDSWDALDLAKEIDRSIDYAINQLGRKHVSKVEMVAPKSEIDHLIRHLSEHTETPVERFIIDDKIKYESDEVKGKVGAENIAAIGAAAYPVGCGI